MNHHIIQRRFSESGATNVRRFHVSINRKLKLIVMACILIPGMALLWILKIGDGQRNTASLEKPAIHLSTERSISVLPFINLNGDSGLDFLCCGIPERIITALLNIPSVLVVAARAPSFEPGTRKENTPPGMVECPAKYALEGSVQSINNRVRITARLLDLATRHYVWAQIFDREPQDMFALQDDIAMEILAKLQEKLLIAVGSADDLNGKDNYNNGALDVDVLSSEHGIVIE
jgi:TolB-like protein